MILQFIQTRTKLSAAYEVLEGDSRLYHAEIPLSIKELSLQLYKLDQMICYITVNHEFKNTFSWAKTKVLSSQNIYNRYNELVGVINLKRTKTFGGYPYYEVSLNQQLFQIYAVGCGKEGIKIPIYYGEEQIALIEKDPTVYNNQDRYQIMAVDEYAADIACLFNLYYDFIRFGHRGEFVSNTKYTNYEYTVNKELKSKYNPQFKEMIMG